MDSIQRSAPKQFDPSRDVDRYGQEVFTCRGLRTAAIDLYRFLCQLSEPGRTRLEYRFQYELANDLQRVAGTSKGFKPSDLTKKLQTLAKRGFVIVPDGSDGGCYWVEILPPESVQLIRRKPRPPTVTTPPSDQQQQLFEPAEGTIGILQSGEDVKRNSVSVSRTIYPRTHAVEDEVESTAESLEGEELDPSVARRRSLVRPPDAHERASDDVTDQEAARARGVLLEIEGKWGRVGLQMPERRTQREADRAMIRRTHVLLQRKIIPDWLLDGAVNRPIDNRRQGKPVNKPMSQFTKFLFEVPWFGRVLGRVKEPLPPEKTQQITLPSREPARVCTPMSQDDLAKSKAEAMRILPRTQFGTPKAGAPDQEPADAG